MKITDTDLQTLEMMGGAFNSGRPDATQPGRTLVSVRDSHIVWINDFNQRAHMPDPPPVVPPVTPPAPPPPVDPTALTAPFRFNIVASPDETYSKRVNGPCRVSVAVLDGNQVGVGWSANRDEWIEGQAGFANGAYEVHVPVGTYWVNVKMGQTMQPKDCTVEGFPTA